MNAAQVATMMPPMMAVFPAVTADDGLHARPRHRLHDSKWLGRIAFGKGRRKANQ
jgi:hypothetical protein